MRAAARHRGYFEPRRDRDRIFFAALHMLESYDVLSTIIVQWSADSMFECHDEAIGIIPFHVFDAPPVYKAAFSGLHITDADVARIARASRGNYAAVVKFPRRPAAQGDS